MATRRLRIKAVANLPARRNRPVTNEPLDSSKDGIKPSSDRIVTAEEISDASTKSPTDIKQSVSDLGAVDNVKRKSVIVCVEKGSTGVKNETHCESETNAVDAHSKASSDTATDKNTECSSLPQINNEALSPSTGGEEGNQGDRGKLSGGKKSVKVVSKILGSPLSELTKLASNKEDNTVQNVRAPLRGRRLKPTVNLPAASRKRCAPDSSNQTLCSSPSSQIRGPNSVHRRVSESDDKVHSLKLDQDLLDPQHDRVQDPLQWKAKNYKSQQSETKELSPVQVPVHPPSPPSSVIRSVSDSSNDVLGQSPETSSGTVSETLASSVKGGTQSSLDKKDSSAGGRRRQTSSSQKTAAARRSLIKRLSKDAPPQRSSLTMFDLIFYNPSSNPMKTETPSMPKARRRSRETSICSVSSVQEDRIEEESVDDVDQNSPSVEEDVAMPVPRVKVGPDGSLILDEQSLVIETTGTKKCREELERSEVVVDTGGGGHYKRTKRSKDWSDHETKKFYRALHVVGTDFSLMQPLFRSRTRREIKLKFKKEEKLNPSLVNKALAQPLDFDISELEKEVAMEEEEERRLADETEKTTEDSCSMRPPEKPQPKPIKKKVVKSNQPRKSFTSLELCEDQLMEEKAGSNDAVKENTSEENQASSIETSKPKLARKTKNTEHNYAVQEQISEEYQASDRETSKPKLARKTKIKRIIVKDEADVDYTMLAMGLDSTPIETKTRNAPKMKLPAAKRSKTCPTSPSTASLSEASSTKVSDQTGAGNVSLSNSVQVLSPLKTKNVSGGDGVQDASPSALLSLSQPPGTPLQQVRVVPSLATPSSIPVSMVTTPSSARLLPTTSPLPKMEPGSIIVLKSPYPQHPDRHILQVYMVTNSTPNSVTPVMPVTPVVPTTPTVPPLPSLVPFVSPTPILPTTPGSSNLALSDDSDSEKVLTRL